MPRCPPCNRSLYNESVEAAVENVPLDKALPVDRRTIRREPVVLLLLCTEAAAQFLEVITLPTEAFPGLIAGRTCVQVPKNDRHLCISFRWAFALPEGIVSLLPASAASDKRRLAQCRLLSESRKRL
jgi:hypothetical protein